MNPSVRDAILRLGSGTDYKQLTSHIEALRKSVAESLTTIDPQDFINIARFQGRVSTYDAILNLTNEAAEAQQAAQGDNNG